MNTKGPMITQHTALSNPEESPYQQFDLWTFCRELRSTGDLFGTALSFPTFIRRRENIREKLLTRTLYFVLKC